MDAIYKMTLVKENLSINFFLKDLSINFFREDLSRVLIFQLIFLDYIQNNIRKKIFHLIFLEDFLKKDFCLKHLQ